MKQTLIIILPISVVLVIILSVGFYWFQLRPAQIRKECIKVANNEEGFNQEKFVAKQLGKEYFNQSRYNNCLLEHGLEK